MQDERPIINNRKKLDSCQRRWPIHEKKFFVMVHRLKMWQCCLGLYKTMVYTKNVSLINFETQTQVSIKQLGWHNTLVLMNVGLIHKLDCINMVPYILN